jgi:uncharacterized damage-inducible protein DinB
MLVAAQETLAELPVRLRAAIAGLGDAQLDTPYREDGWTVRQLVHHIPDSHLNAYCRFRLALTEHTPTIKPYQEALWAELPDARTMPVGPSIELVDGLHRRWLGLMQDMTPEQWERAFVHPEHPRPMTLWQTAALYAWHSRHHVAHITSLRDRKGWNG